MDSVENIRKDKKKRLIYSVILLVVGIFLGFSSFYIFGNKTNDGEIVPLNNKTTNNDSSEDDNIKAIAESLLNGYIGYYENILINSEEKISYSDREAYYVDNSFNELHDLFTSNITPDTLFNYYDHDSGVLREDDPIKPVYLKINDYYYFDGECESSGNKVFYSDFNVLNRNKDTIELGYRITVMTIVDDSIMESSEESTMTIKLENGSWKINNAKVMGRCGVPYEVG